MILVRPTPVPREGRLLLASLPIGGSPAAPSLSVTVTANVTTPSCQKTATFGILLRAQLHNVRDGRQRLQPVRECPATPSPRANHIRLAQLSLPQEILPQTLRHLGAQHQLPRRPWTRRNSMLRKVIWICKLDWGRRWRGCRRWVECGGVARSKSLLLYPWWQIVVSWYRSRTSST